VGDLDLASAVIRRVHVDFPHMRVGNTQQGVDILSVQLPRCLKEMAGVSCRLKREVLIPGRSSAQRMIDRVESAGVLTCESTTFCSDELDMDVASQAGRDLVLHVREIDPFLVEALSPQMRAAL